MIRHRYEQALTLAERSVALHEQYPPGHGLAVALATLGQVCIRLGALSRAADALHRRARRPARRCSSTRRPAPSSTRSRRSI